MEIITGVERRRHWRPDEKLRILAELGEPGTKFVDVARRHEVSRGLLWQWRDAPTTYGPHKTLYNRFVRWSRMGVFDRIFAALAAQGGAPERLMIDSTHLKAHRTAASLLKKGLFPVASAEPRGG